MKQWRNQCPNERNELTRNPPPPQLQPQLFSYSHTYTHKISPFFSSLDAHKKVYIFLPLLEGVGCGFSFFMIFSMIFLLQLKEGRIGFCFGRHLVVVAVIIGPNVGPRKRNQNVLHGGDEDL